jgi:phosphomannomutase
MSQISLETTTQLAPEVVIEKAKETFAKEHGLEVAEEAKCCIRLEGGGGYVYIRAEETEQKTSVTLEGREWSYQLKNFMQAIAS